MPQQLHLEGPDPHELLVRAREQYGPHVAVVRAERVRSGGVLGFFAREMYELTLEVPDAALAIEGEAPGPRPAVQPRGPLGDIRNLPPEVAAEIADAEALRAEMLAGSTQSTRVPAPEVPAQTQAPAASSADAFQRALDDVAEMLGERIASRGVDPLTGSVVVPDVATPDLEPDADQFGGTLPDAGGAPSSPPRAGHGSRPFTPMAFPAADPAAVVLPSNPEPAWTRRGEQVVEITLATQVEVDEPAPLVIPQLEPSPPSPAEALEVPEPNVVLHRWGVQADLVGAVEVGPTAAELLALGVPPRLLGERVSLAERVPLLDMIARLGAPTQRRLEPGELLVVAGEPGRALAVARQVSSWMGLEAESVVLAGECEAIRGHGRRVRTEAAARALRGRAEGLAAEGVPLVVALGVGPGRRGAIEAAPLLAAARADTAWFAVDAAEARGVTAAMEPLAVGAHLDGIAAVGVGRSQAPASLLDAELPVAWMDGLPASPTVWGALLAERVAAQR